MLLRSRDIDTQMVFAYEFDSFKGLHEIAVVPAIAICRLSAQYVFFFLLCCVDSNEEGMVTRGSLVMCK